MRFFGGVAASVIVEFFETFAGDLITAGARLPRDSKLKTRRPPQFDPLASANCQIHIGLSSIRVIHENTFSFEARGHVENLQNLHWQLSVLSKAIHYKNLSGAAAHVGLSQPQLSRIIARLEDELGIVLLDRSARRKSGWTPIAFKVASTYFTAARKLTQSLQQLTDETHVHSLAVGTLEGLIPQAIEFCHLLFDRVAMQMVELDVFDLSQLEEHFEKDELDVIFTCREPGKHKFKHSRLLGYQSLEKSGSGSGPKVFSPFDYANHVNKGHARRATHKDQPVLLSNSLAVRKLWIEDYGGQGTVPSSARKNSSGSEDVPILMIASDLFNPSLWQKIEQFRL